MSDKALRDYYKLLAELWRKRLEVLRNARTYAKMIKDFCVKEIDKECRVILFGSVVRGNYRIDSDVDVLVIVNKKLDDAIERSKIRVKIFDYLGGLEYSPIELHVITPKEYEDWYKHFLDVYEEIK